MIQQENISMTETETETETVAVSSTRRFRNNRGFTMIELVIGIAVLAILGGIGVAGYSSLIGDSAQRAMEKNLQGFETSMAKHYADHGRYPTSINATAGFVSTPLVIGYNSGTAMTLTLPSAPTNASWTASVIHSKRPGMTCAITVRAFGASPITCTGG